MRILSIQAPPRLQRLQITLSAEITGIMHTPHYLTADIMHEHPFLRNLGKSLGTSLLLAEGEVHDSL